MLRFQLTFISAAVVAASLIAAQPDQILPAPPGIAPAQGYAAPNKTPTQSPTQAPTQAPAAVCAPQTVTCTVMVPQTTYKTVTVPSIQFTPEQRQQNIAVCRMVPETQMVNCTTTIVVPEQRTAQKTFTTCRMTYETARWYLKILFQKTETPAGEAKTLLDQLRHRARGVHAGPKVGVVVAPTTHCTNDRHHMGCAVGEMCRQPFSEEIFHLPWKS